MIKMMRLPKRKQARLAEITIGNKRRLILGAATAFAAFLVCAVSSRSLPLSLLSALLILLPALFTLRFNKPAVGEWICIVWSAICSLLTCLLIQIIQVKGNPFTMPLRELLYNCLLCMSVYLLLFILFARYGLSIVVGSALLLLLGTVNYYVYSFRGSELTPMDFLSLRTAINVAGEYHLTLDPFIVLAWSGFLAMAFCTTVIRFDEHKGGIWRRCAAIVCLLGCAFLFHRGVRNIQGTHWNNDGTYLHGYLENFALSFRQLNLSSPDGYSLERIQMIEENYRKADEPVDPGKTLPDVIVIMNESFADFSVYGEKYRTNRDAIPFYHSLSENAIKGYALASVFGGSTANSEFELLTGNSMAFLPEISIPYQQYIHGSTYNLASVFHRYGYYCFATHPYIASGWSRPTVYKAFGFDEMTFEEDYPNKDRVRNFISDDEFVDYIIGKYQSLKNHNNVFMHCVSVQNHGAYDYAGEDFQNTISIEGLSGHYPQAEQYLSLSRLTDLSIEKLLRYFEAEDRDVVIVFFGDHQPRVEQDFYEELHGGDFASLDEKMLQYMVPFFVWTNYDIEEEYVPCTSINYLSNYIFAVSDIPDPMFSQFLADTEQAIPSINALGYYSTAEQRFLPFPAAAGQEKEILRNYEILQYNVMFDQSNLSGFFSDDTK